MTVIYLGKVFFTIIYIPQCKVSKKSTILTLCQNAGIILALVLNKFK